jgi:hypothetical protein
MTTIIHLSINVYFVIGIGPVKTERGNVIDKQVRFFTTSNRLASDVHKYIQLPLLYFSKTIYVI